MKCVELRFQRVPLREDLLYKLKSWGGAGMLPNCKLATLDRQMRNSRQRGAISLNKKMAHAFYQHLRLHEGVGRPRNILNSVWRFKIRNVPNLLFDAVGCIPGWSTKFRMDY